MSGAGPGTLVGASLIAGTAQGEVVWSDTPLSFMGGVDPLTGIVIDTHHPLHGVSITGKVLALPSGRGSCSGSGTIFEMLFNATAPAALVLGAPETILPVGVMIAEELLGTSIPVVRLAPDDFASVAHLPYAHIRDGRVASAPLPEAVAVEQARPSLTLNEYDVAALAGEHGEALRVAMRVITRAAELEGAGSLIDVTSSHIDGCFYQGPGSVAFAARLCELGAQVRVPATTNAMSVDRARWRDQGVPAEVGEPASLIADYHARMGVRPTFTCAPYLLPGAPEAGQQIAWAESNAVVFANSVLGARTVKYPDYLDLLIAIAGRAPLTGPHLDEGRRATVIVEVDEPDGVDDAFYPALGYLVGSMCPHDIPLIRGLAPERIGVDDLKGFGAAFATTSASPMFHIAGVTPEAATALEDHDDASMRVVHVGPRDLAQAWNELNSATEPDVDLVSLGNPHFSYNECARLADLLDGRRVHDGVSLVVTCGRDTYLRARTDGLIDRIEASGGTVINDTCWCFIGRPVVPEDARRIMTNSGKYAHYGTAATGCDLHYGSLADCVDAAVTGTRRRARPLWLA